MIFRILKKDCKLLWPLALLIAFAHAISTLLWWYRDHGGLSDDLINVSKILPLIAALGSAILSLFVIHTDPIPGDREDWLTRPIRPFDLLAAKFLFVLLAVIAPVFLISAVEGLVDGFSLLASLTAAFGHCALLFLICLPAIMLGAITGNAMEAMVGAAIAVALAGASLIFNRIFGIHQTLPSYGGAPSGLQWVQSAELMGIVVVTALIILPLQYLRRYTSFSRLLVIPLFLLMMSYQQLPFKVAFSAQQRLASVGSISDGVTINYDAGSERSRRTAQGAAVRGPASLINLPIRVDGIAAADVLIADRAEIRLIANGKVLYQQPSALGIAGINAFANAETQLRQEGSSGAAIHGYQAILLPTPLLGRIRSSELTLAIDYSLSLFHKTATATFAALNDSKHLAKIGWCKTQVDDDGDEVNVQCVQAGQIPNCAGAALENPATQQRNPEAFVCEPDYSPIPITFYPDGLARFYLSSKFRDIDNVAKYPVNESQLGKARMDLSTYQPTAHFTRHVVIHGIRLADWEADEVPQ
jgi:hypothetical protein